MPTPPPPPTPSQRRLWNRGPLLDLFPRLPPASLNHILDLALAKNCIYDLSAPKRANAIRLTCLAIAHARHAHSEYDALLRAGVERFEARERTGEAVWRVLREWCPWDESNVWLEGCWAATVVRPEERGLGWEGEWEMMDLDVEEGWEGGGGGEDDGGGGEPMDLD
ncbi:hypothetical protein WHR41_04175 [Cladosporium halotolerans]|uniref:DUF2293 domain-containing protein n=1 Tax=Cladosporium halotolerans TaxID=1052096 RepID=A0AB34KRX5_9PEZI